MKVEKVSPTEQISLTLTGTKEEFKLLQRILGLNQTVPAKLGECGYSDFTPLEITKFMDDLRYKLDGEI